MTIKIPELNKDLEEILGRTNFVCGPIARVLRVRGHEIKEKAEAEQAFVLHWLLTMYEQHGKDWRDKAVEYLNGKKEVSDAVGATKVSE